MLANRKNCNWKNNMFQISACDDMWASLCRSYASQTSQIKKEQATANDMKKERESESGGHDTG